MHLVVTLLKRNKSMNIIDISWPLSAEMTAYKDKKTMRIERVKQFDVDGVQESTLFCNMHSGTHIDAPAHFVKDGVSVDKLSLSSLMGPCKVIDMMHVAQAITAQDLQSCDIKAGDRVLFKTQNSALAPTAPFNPQFIYIDASAAQWLVDAQIIAVGIDYLGIERNQPHHETHTKLMHANITIIEGLRLEHVNAGAYTLYCLPLHVMHSDAALARAVLVHV